MHWVMKDSAETSPPPGQSDGIWAILQSFAARPSAGTPPPKVIRQVSKAKVAARARAVSHLAYVPWDTKTSAVARDALTAWCEDKVGLRAAILARAPVIVVPSGAAGLALLEGVAKLDGVAFARVGQSDKGADKGADEVQDDDGRAAAGDATTGDVAAFTALVQAALSGIAARATHLVVTVEGRGLHAPEILATLQRLADRASAGEHQVERRVQVVLAGGPALYLRLAEERLHEIRDEARAEAGPDLASVGADPEARLTTGQRIGALVGVTMLVLLAAGPLVSMGFAGQVAAPPAASPMAVPMAVLASTAAVPATAAVPVANLVPNPTQDRVRRQREFEASLVASGKDVQRLRAPERERLFQEYVAQQDAPKPRRGLVVADRHD